MNFHDKIHRFMSSLKKYVTSAERPIHKKSTHEYETESFIKSRKQFIKKNGENSFRVHPWRHNNSSAEVFQNNSLISVLFICKEF